MNKETIEVQLMKKFCQEQAVHNLSLQCDEDVFMLLPPSFSKEFSSVDSKLALETYSLAVGSLNGKLNFGNISLLKLLPPYKESVLDAISYANI